MRLWVLAAVLAMVWLVSPQLQISVWWGEMVMLAFGAVAFFGAGWYLLDPLDRDGASVLMRNPICPYCGYSLVGHIRSKRRLASSDLVCSECGAPKDGSGLGGYEVINALIALVGMGLILTAAFLFFKVVAMLRDELGRF